MVTDSQKKFMSKKKLEIRRIINIILLRNASRIVKPAIVKMLEKI